jgi:pSer/pThr/pTyr-binding forkhead associated (FHA) protein
MVSRLHAEFTLCGSRTRQVWCVQDKNSTNGLLVNDYRLTAGVAHALTSGDIVTFGMGRHGERGLCEYTFYEHKPDATMPQKKYENTAAHCSQHTAAKRCCPRSKLCQHKPDATMSQTRHGNIAVKPSTQPTSRAASPMLPTLLFAGVI